MQRLVAALIILASSLSACDGGGKWTSRPCLTNGDLPGWSVIRDPETGREWLMNQEGHIEPFGWRHPKQALIEKERYERLRREFVAEHGREPEPDERIWPLSFFSSPPPAFRPPSFWGVNPRM